jgi:hypothetical protein
MTLFHVDHDDDDDDDDDKSQYEGLFPLTPISCTTKAQPHVTTCPLLNNTVSSTSLFCHFSLPVAPYIVP